MRKIYVLGPAFSYSYNLAVKKYANWEIICCESITEAIKQAMQDESTRALVPVENMLGGSVRETLFGLQKKNAQIVQVIDYEINNVIAAQKSSFKKVASHSQALDQCNNFIQKRKLEKIEMTATSKAMELAAEDEEVAAIGSPEAAQHYGLKVISQKISNKANNTTRFLEIKRANQGKERAAGEKTSLIITPKEDRAGLLFEILSVFQVKKINLTKIESMPTGRKMNDYLFYLEIEGALKDKEVKEAINFLRTWMKVDVFGSYNTISC